MNIIKYYSDINVTAGGKKYVANKNNEFMMNI